VATLEEPGAALLAGLLSELREQPADSTAQVLERWRERPESAHLARLASAEELVPSLTAAHNELQDALQRLLQEAERRSLDRLLEKDRASGLTAEEKLELQRLTSSLAREPRRAQAS